MKGIYSDLDNKFRLSRVGDLRINYDEEAVVTAVENILLTKVGERVMRPDFGSYLEKYLFEPLSEEVAYKIGLEVLRALKQDDRYDVENVDVAVDERRGAYVLTINLKLRGFGERLQIVRILTRV